MAAPKVSIIIPVHNAEKYLHQCIDSIRKQSLEDIEIIPVVDLSIDRQAAHVLEQYALKDKRIKIINQKNNGVSCSRNSGIISARGEYIGFVDSDDAISKNMYEAMYRAAKDHDADIVTAGYARCDKNLNVTAYHYPAVQCNKPLTNSEKRALIVKANGKDSLLHVFRNIFRRKMILENKILFVEEIRIGEDTPFNLHAFYSAKNVVAMDKAFYFYRQNPESITQTRYKPHLEKSLQIQYEKKVQFYKDHDIFGDCFKGLYESVSANLLPMMLFNVFEQDNFKLKWRAEIKKILDFNMVKKSLDNTPLINRKLPAGKQFIIAVSKLKLYRLLWLFYLYKHGLR